MRADIDYRGINALNSAAILGDAMLNAAEVAKAEAQRIAPKASGQYADTMFARKTRGKSATAVYGATQFYAPYVEYGSRTKKGRWRITPHHTLSKAAQHVGLRIRKA